MTKQTARMWLHGYFLGYLYTYSLISFKLMDYPGFEVQFVKWAPKILHTYSEHYIDVAIEKSYNNILSEIRI